MSVFPLARSPAHLGDGVLVLDVGVVEVYLCEFASGFTWTTDTLRLRIMGVGFLDRPHGQLGAAPNYFELHPLGIDFP